MKNTQAKKDINTQIPVNLKDPEYCLYKTYMHELWRYTPSDNKDERLLPVYYADLTNNPKIQHLKVYHNGKYIGFLFLQELDKKDRRILRCKYYVCEAYIKPSYRKHGLMSDLLNTALCNEHLSEGVCLHVIRNNTSADLFWKEYFHNRGCDYATLRKYKGYEHCNFYRFYKPASGRKVDS